MLNRMSGRRTLRDKPVTARRAMIPSLAASTSLIKSSKNTSPAGAVQRSNSSSQPYAPPVWGRRIPGTAAANAAFQSELVPLWIDLLGSLAKNDFSSGPSPGIRNGAATHGTSRPSDPVVIELRSKGPVRATFEARSSAPAAALATAGLHALEAGKPALADIALLPDESGRWAKVSITVPDEQPSGRYTGVIVDRVTGEVRGTLTIEIE